LFLSSRLNLRTPYGFCILLLVATALLFFATSQRAYGEGVTAERQDGEGEGPGQVVDHHDRTVGEDGSDSDGTASVSDEQRGADSGNSADTSVASREDSGGSSQKRGRQSEEDPYQTLNFEAGGRGEFETIWWNDNYREFQPWQYGTLLAGAASLTVALFVEDDPEEPRWTGAGPFDRFFESRIGADRRDVQRRYRIASDVLYGVTTPLPVVLDGALMLPIIRKSPEVAAQVLLIDLQSFAFTSLVYFGTRALTQRARPELSECIDELGEENCDYVRSANHSFISGHTAFAFTGAGLICTHQRYLDIYRSERAGRALCGASMAAATVAASFRIVANRHWASDVLAGAAVGLFSGLALPRLLHFSPPRLRSVRSVPAFVFAHPTFQRGGAGIQVTTIF
jgi:membrane-associated phospholipid phosphatase